jgi:hypothetical protein
MRRLWPPTLLILLLATLAGLWWQQDTAIDWLRLRDYRPPEQVSQLADQVTMTPYAQRLFYVNRPQVEGKIAFNQHCPNASREVAVLGCYRGDRQGIFMYHITDKRLDGIEQVTAAHEMLHQAYDRLSNSEKQRVSGLLHAYEKTVTDQALKDKIDAYRKLEPHEVDTEMHSVFGTEAAALPKDLETYYARYFTDRRQVLSYHAQSRAAFDQRQKQLKDYDKQLEDLNRRIGLAREGLKQSESALQAERSQMDAWLKSGRTAEYNAAVPGYNSKVIAYKASVVTTNVLINDYNALIDRRNAIAVEEQELIKAQDSNASSADAQ